MKGGYSYFSISGIKPNYLYFVNYQNSILSKHFSMIRPPLAKLASVKLSLLLLLLVIVFNVAIMPNLTGDKKAVPIDIHFAYSPEKAYELINSYSDATRKSYMIGSMTLDVIYPVVYVLFLSFSLVVLFRKYEKLAWLPYFLFVSDLLENTGIITLLYNYPKELYHLAIVTSVFSTVKWILSILIVLILCTGLVMKIAVRLKESKLP